MTENEQANPELEDQLRRERINMLVWCLERCANNERISAIMQQISQRIREERP